VSGAISLAAPSGQAVKLGTSVIGGTIRTLQADGSGSNISINMVPKGTGVVSVSGNLAIGTMDGNYSFRANYGGATTTSYEWQGIVQRGTASTFSITGNTTASLSAITFGNGANPLWITFSNLPTSAAGLGSGMFWRDAAASNVVKCVP
jgi:hypothetical protein